VSRDDYFAHWVHAADKDRVVEAFSRMDASGAPLDVEYQVSLRDGRTRYIHHIAQAVQDANGRVAKHVGTMHDVTDRRHAEDEARQLQDRLTHFSRLSTMGEMAAGLAHEINQPLSAIATYAQASQRFLKQPEPDIDEVVAALEQINAQALRAGEVIRRLRQFVKNREVKREAVDCGRLLDDLRTLAETDARLHNIRLRIDAEEPLPTVYADPIQLQQVVLNLVRNAIDAMVDAPQDRREVLLMTRRCGEGRSRSRSRTTDRAWLRKPPNTCSTPFSRRSRGGRALARHQQVDRARPWRPPVAHSQCGIRRLLPFHAAGFASKKGV